MIQFLFRLNDAIAVVPDPQKGSNTHPFSGQLDLIILSIAKVHLAPFSKRQDHNVGDDHTGDRPVGMVTPAK